jgi:hypothetical protein
MSERWLVGLGAVLLMTGCSCQKRPKGELTPGNGPAPARATDAPEPSPSCSGLEDYARSLGPAGPESVSVVDACEECEGRHVVRSTP